MNHTVARLWGAGALLSNPERLIDLLLDRLEELSLAMLPPQAELVPCRERRPDPRFD